MKNHRLVLATALVLAVTAVPAMANHSWGSYHWSRCSNPFNVDLGDNVNSTWDPHLVTASADWSLSSVLDTTIVTGGASPKTCRPTAGRVEVCNANYGQTGWLGVAQIWVSGSHITQATVKLNDTYHNSAPYNTSAWRQMVMCQEIGHTFGLAHQDENFNNANLGSCMDYTNDPSTNQHPNSHDYEQLEAIYSHLDPCGALLTQTAPPAMYQLDLSDAGQWGELVFSSEDGSEEVYVLDFGHGHRVLTHVTWVPGRPAGDSHH